MGSTFTLIPRPVGCFAGLDMTTRYAFGLIYDRWKLSNRKENRSRFTDRFGTYCVFSREAMAAEMGISLPTLRAAMKLLQYRGVIEARTDSGGPWRYYVPSSTVEWLEDPDLAVINDVFGTEDHGG